MEEATNADQIVVMKQGEIIAQGTPNTLKEQYASDQLIIALKEDAELKCIQSIVHYPIFAAGDVFKINLPSTLHAILILEQIQSFISSFEVVKGSLDQVFIQINEKK